MKKLTINPNKTTRDVVFNNLISKRPHATWTPSKREKVSKLNKINKQHGWINY